MPERGQQEKLNQQIDAILARRSSTPPHEASANTEPLARIAEELCGLPREDFKAILKADLIRGGKMSGEAAKMTAAQQTAVPYLCFKNAARALQFYQEIFGAEETMRLTDPGKRIGHAEMLIGNARIMLSDEFPEYGAISPETLGGSTVKINLMVPDVDTTVNRAVDAGAKIVRPVQDQFYGERSGQIADPFGYTWIIATHKEDVTPAEMQKRWNDVLEQPRETIDKKAASETTPKQPSSEKHQDDASAVNYIRAGFRTVSPYILVNGAAKFIDFLVEAFGATERGRVPVAGGKLMHAEVQVGDSTIEMSDGSEQYGPSPVTIHLTVPDAEEAYRRAVNAGAVSLYEPAMQFYGEFEGGVRDPFGNEWYITPQAKKHQHPTVQPYLHLRDAEKMISFLEAAFGAKAEGVHKIGVGIIAHATVFIGNGQIEIDEAFRANRQMPCHLHLYVPDTDAVYAKALKAGATVIEPPSDKPYGDRSAGVKDAWGNSWFIATHMKDVSF
ncbi:MAG TPA: VOC family protein [Verrucomicrobiae bacterium]|nr:VOC family protein [Verrucomicrobiae bacterium]